MHSLLSLLNVKMSKAEPVHMPCYATTHFTMSRVLRLSLTFRSQITCRRQPRTLWIHYVLLVTARSPEDQITEKLPQANTEKIRVRSKRELRIQTHSMRTHNVAVTCV